MLLATSLNSPLAPLRNCNTRDQCPRSPFPAADLTAMFAWVALCFNWPGGFWSLVDYPPLLKVTPVLWFMTCLDAPLYWTALAVFAIVLSLVWDGTGVVGHRRLPPSAANPLSAVQGEEFFPPISFLICAIAPCPLSRQCFIRAVLRPSRLMCVMNPFEPLDCLVFSCPISAPPLPFPPA